MAHLLLSTIAYLAACSAIVLITIWAFIRLTKYNDWEEIKNGNVSAAMALGGKVFGVGNIIRFAIESNSNLPDTLLWGFVGMVLLLLVYLLFEWLTPKININKEIASGNSAVGLLSMVFSITFSYIVGASIT